MIEGTILNKVSRKFIISNFHMFCIKSLLHMSHCMLSGQRVVNSWKMFKMILGDVFQKWFCSSLSYKALTLLILIRLGSKVSFNLPGLIIQTGFSSRIYALSEQQYPNLRLQQNQSISIWNPSKKVCGALRFATHLYHYVSMPWPHHNSISELMGTL